MVSDCWKLYIFWYIIDITFIFNNSSPFPICSKHLNLFSLKQDGEPQEERQPNKDDFGLEVAQIVITAATPMAEEPEQSFPPPEENVNSVTITEIGNDVIEEEDEEEEEEEVKEEPKKTDSKAEEKDEEKVAEEDPPPESGIHVSSSTGSEGETTGPSTAENSISHVPDEPKQVVGGRASIPDELEPHQLACLQNLKESNA